MLTSQKQNEEPEFNLETLKKALEKSAKDANELHKELKKHFGIQRHMKGIILK